MPKFEFHLDSGKIVTVEGVNKTDASRRAVEQKLLTAGDFYDVIDIIEIRGQVTVSEEVKENTKHKADKPKFPEYKTGGNWH